MNLRYGEDSWLGGLPTHPDIDLEVAGTAEGPELQWLALAERVIPNADRYIQASLTYLRHFIVPSHFDCAGKWEAMGFYFGLANGFVAHPEADFFVAFAMPADDIYGTWTVAFKNPYHDRFEPVPVAFSRMQV